MISVSVENLVFGYKRHQPLFDQTNFKLELPNNAGHGSVVAIVGSSGSGKTTLLKLIAGIEKPLEGLVQYSPLNATVSYLPQDAVLFENLSREANARYYQFLSAHRENFREDIFQSLVDKLRLRHTILKADQVNNLSGGERQRLALLRALSVRPKLMLLDEPCNGLDTSVKQEFLSALRELADELEILVIYVTHHRDEVMLLADHVLHLDTQPKTNLCFPSLWKLSEFLDHPPTLEAAQFVSGLPLNVLPCVIKGKKLFDEQESVVLAQLSSSISVEGCFTVAFLPSIVKAGNHNELTVSSISFSEQFAFLYIIGINTKIKVIAYRDSAISKSIFFNGKAMLFDSAGKLVQKVELQHP